MDAPSTAAGPPLTSDDLIDLHSPLEADDLFLQLMAESLLAGDQR